MARSKARPNSGPAFSSAGRRCATSQPESYRDSPPERLRRLGIQLLADREILALILREGSRCASALEISGSVLSKGGGGLAFLATASQEELGSVRGVGPAKAAALIAAIELGKRMASRELRKGDLIRSARDVHRHFHQRMRAQRREQFMVLLLDGRNRVMAESQISKGTLTASLVHPREVFRPAIRAAAAGIVLVHNHPSGDPSPSREDLTVTRRLMDAGKVVGIPIVDHVVVAERGFHSFQESGDMAE